MSTIVTRAGKGSPLSNTELDTNFTNLNADKLEANRTNPLSQAVRVAMTVATSGSSGINTASGVSYEPGTDNIFLWWLGALPDWTPASTVYLFAKRQNADNYWGLQINTDGTVAFSAVVGGTNVIAFASSTIATGQTDGDIALITCSITRETASSAGSIEYGVNGLQLGATKTITAASPVSITNTGRLEICGRNGARYACTYLDGGICNRALSAGEVLSFAKNGPARADLGASQVPVRTYNFSAGVDGSAGSAGVTVTGNVDGIGGKDNVLECVTNGTNFGRVLLTLGSTPIQPEAELEIYIPSTNVTLNGLNLRFSVADSTTIIQSAGFQPALDTWTKINFGGVTNGQATTLRVYLFANGTGTGLTSGDKLYIASGSTIKKIGITGQWNAENAQSNTGQIFDSSGNGNHALLPAAGATVMPQNLQPAVRWINTWSGTSELQYIGGVNQNIIPDDCYFESIVIVPSGSTLTGFTIGNGSNAAYYSTVSVPVTSGVPIYVALSNRFPDANRKLTITPMGAFTGSLAATVSTRILETA